MRLAGTVFALAFAGACGSFGEAESVPAPPPSDGGLSSDASSSDAASESDGANAGDAGDVFAALCQTALFCEKFDTGTSQWTNVNGEFQVLSEPANGKFVRGTFPASNGTEFIRHAVAGAGSDVHFSVALRVQDPGYSNQAVNANYAVAGFESTDFKFLVVLYLNRGAADGFATAEVSGGSVYESFKGGASDRQLAYGTWHRVDIELHLGASGSFSWALDGKSAGGDSLKTDVTGVSAVLGSKRPNSVPPAAQVDFDDILVQNL